MDPPGRGGGRMDRFRRAAGRDWRQQQQNDGKKSKRSEQHKGIETWDEAERRGEKEIRKWRAGREREERFD